MAPIHHIMAHFPIALLSLAFLVILLRALTGNEVVRRLESTALVFCLVLGLAGGLGALATGLLIWPAEATVASTMGRNKILMASWTLGVWSVVLALRWRVGDTVWNGVGRYLMVGLGTFGAVLLATIGTLGGHLLGAPSRFSGLLHQFGWSVYQTYYAPHWVLYTMVAVGVAAVGLGVLAARSRTPAETYGHTPALVAARREPAPGPAAS